MEAENVPAVGTAIIKRNQSHMLVKQEEVPPPIVAPPSFFLLPIVSPFVCDGGTSSSY